MKHVLARKLANIVILFYFFQAHRTDQMVMGPDCRKLFQRICSSDECLFSIEAFQRLSVRHPLRGLLRTSKRLTFQFQENTYHSAEQHEGNTERNARKNPP
eukprot:gnl/TRDRNA2_/TRDRNA2_31216_c0_seq1.p3 gnl/TRDRNA2_/TRDRNA2_31216_c0~~gnl/TRDRNA2_/TRDRNA2_31216_c0_seq1.p3  ORF type:complete len:101 (-),score=13.73 gnl/TRDRNA2_/TRDRNA2_31216_c0_seq1:81-383(-)